MVKVFSCGCTSTVQPFKQVRIFNVSFACQKCLKEGAINVGDTVAAGSLVATSFGRRSVMLVTKQVRVAKR